MIRIFFFVIFWIMVTDCIAEHYRQEGAVVKYWNPRYFSECTALTKRMKRGEPYRTNFTSVTLSPWYNNVTLHITYGIKSYTDLISVKWGICDMFEVQWLREYFKNFANFPATCPIQEGLVAIYNMEFPPKNFPFPLPRGADLVVKFWIEI